MTGRWGSIRSRATRQTARLTGMSRARVVAASIALALVPVSVLTGVIVAPSYAASSDTPPEITWDQVAAAQASVAATKKLADQIKAQVAALQASVDAAQAEAKAKGDVYAKAQDAFDSQEYIVERLQTQADAARKEADAAKKTAGQLLAQLAKSGGADGLTTSLLSDSGQADQLLSKVGYMSQITDRSKQIYAKALRLQKGAQALTDQADAAKVILAKLKDTAQAAFAAAQAAADAADAALKAAQATFARPVGQAHALTKQAAKTLAGYNEFQAAKWGPGDRGPRQRVRVGEPGERLARHGFGMRWWPFPPHGWRLHTGQDISGTGMRQADLRRALRHGHLRGPERRPGQLHPAGQRRRNFHGLWPHDQRRYSGPDRAARRSRSADRQGRGRRGRRSDATSTSSCASMVRRPIRCPSCVIGGSLLGISRSFHPSTGRRGSLMLRI